VFARNRQRPRIVAADRLFWLALRRIWLRWSDVLVFVKPETVVRWHQTSFRRYWTWLSRRRRRGRPPIEARLCALIHRMALENPTWGAPRIHGELRMLGFEVSERSVSRCLPRGRPPPGALERWLTFLRCQVLEAPNEGRGAWPELTSGHAGETELAPFSCLTCATAGGSLCLARGSIIDR